MIALLRIPHGLVRRHLSAIETAITALILAGLVYTFLVGVAAYPSPWELVLCAMILLAMLNSPTLAYFLTVAVLIYPIYTLSVYLAVLFVAVALLGQRLFINHWGAVLLTLALPVLAQLQIVWLIPLLAGLWWGKSGGWMAAFAALWGQILYGMMGLSPDWLRIVLVESPPYGQIAARFASASSLDTLKLLIAPLSPDPTFLLYLLMQIALFGGTAALIGAFSERGWFLRNAPLSHILLGIGGLALLTGGLLLEDAWLEASVIASLPELLMALQWNAGLAFLAVSILLLARDFFEHPLAFGAQRSARGKLRPELTRSAEEGNAFSKPALFASLTRLRARLINAPQAAKNASPVSPLPEELKPYSPLPIPDGLTRLTPKKARAEDDDTIKIEFD